MRKERRKSRHSTSRSVFVHSGLVGTCVPLGDGLVDGGDVSYGVGCCSREHMGDWEEVDGEKNRCQIKGNTDEGRDNRSPAPG